MLTIPFLRQLETSERILIAGAGGGYDVFVGLPLYFALKAAGKEVYLANYSFSFLPPAQFEERLTKSMVTMSADSPRLGSYGPERLLAEWFRVQKQTELAIYCFERTGVSPLQQSYEKLVELFQLDTIILVDGGTDSLMRGDEDGLGTPVEDLTSMTAVDQLDIPNKFLLCLGFGVDRFHGVSNWLSLKAIAELSKTGGFLGSFSLHKEMPEVANYLAASEYVFERMPDHISIVSSSIIAAINGEYGNYHTTERTRNSELWINPLMACYFTFNLAEIVARNQYAQRLVNSETLSEVSRVIADHVGTVRAQQKRQIIPD